MSDDLANEVMLETIELDAEPYEEVPGTIDIDRHFYLRATDPAYLDWSTQHAAELTWCTDLEPIDDELVRWRLTELALDETGRPYVVQGEVVTQTREVTLTAGSRSWLIPE